MRWRRSLRLLEESGSVMAKLNSRVSWPEDYKTREFHSSDKPLGRPGFLALNAVVRPTLRNTDHETVISAPGSRRGLSRQMLLEEFQRPAPGQVRRFLVVAGLVGVVEEGVLGAVVHVEGVVLAALLQGVLEGGDAGIDALVGSGIVQQERRLDLRHLLGQIGRAS